MFAVGTTKNADLAELKMITGTEKNARQYNTFKNFFDDRLDVFKELCDLPCVQPTRPKPPAKDDPNNGGIETDNPEYKFSVDFKMKSVVKMSTRYFTMPYDPGSIMKFSWKASVSMKIHYSFTHKHPCQCVNDFQNIVKPGKTTPTIVRPPGELCIFVFFFNFDLKRSTST